MIIRTFVIGMVIVGITFILAELHRYQVYKAEINKWVKKEGGTVYRSRGQESGR